VTQSRAGQHTSQTEGKDPWDVFDDKGRLEFLGSVLTRGVETSVRELVAAKP